MQENITRKDDDKDYQNLIKKNEKWDIKNDKLCELKAKKNIEWLTKIKNKFRNLKGKFHQ